MSRNKDRFLNKLRSGLILTGGHTAEVFLFVLIALVAVDVVLRYVFNSPTQIADELGGYLLVGMAFTGATYALHVGTHVKVTLFTERLPRKALQWLIFITESMAEIGVIVLVWKSTELVIKSYGTGIKSAGYMATPMWIPQVIVPIGLTIFALHILINLIWEAGALFTPSDEPQPVTSERAEHLE
ncbi:TRAP transporter small permease [Chloroflexota bacterium]